MTDKQFRFARTSQCYCLGQRENACSKANCTQMNGRLFFLRDLTSGGITATIQTSTTSEASLSRSRI